MHFHIHIDIFRHTHTHTRTRVLGFGGLGVSIGMVGCGSISNSLAKQHTRLWQNLLLSSEVC